MAKFNGTTVTWAAAGLTPLVGVTYTGSCTEVDVGGSADASQLVEAGIPDETTTVELIGKAALAVGATGALAVTWQGGGTDGTIAAGIITGVSDGGGYDGEITTTYTFRPT